MGRIDGVDRQPAHGLLLTGDQMTPDEMAAWARRAEERGFESVWVTEAFWDALVPLTLMAKATTRVRLGTACAIVSRQPHVAQLGFAGVDRVSGGRLVLGLADGPSGPNSDWHGVRPKSPAKRMREHVELMGLMIAAHSGKQIEFHGDYYDITSFGRWAVPARDSIPVLLGVMTPVMCRLSGEIADGYIGAALNSNRYFDDIVAPNIQEGRARAGREASPFEFASVRICSISEDGQRAREVAKQTIGFYAGIAPALGAVLDHHGFAEVRRSCERAIAAWDFHAAAAAIPDDVVDIVAVAGTPDEARDRLAEYERGLDTVILYPPSLGLEKGEIEEAHVALVETFGNRSSA